MLSVGGIRLNLDEPIEALGAKVAAKLRIAPNRIAAAIPLRESLDARHKSDIHFVYTVGVRLTAPGEEAALAARFKNTAISYISDAVAPPPPLGSEKLSARPIVVGAGPAGLFAALALAEAGYAPLLLERGAPVDTRTQHVSELEQSGTLNPESNIAFGEGGAGTFSDGKLTFRARDAEGMRVLDALADCGAPDAVRYSARAHVGTDVLRGVVKNLRHAIERAGGQVRFFTKVEDLVVRDGHVVAVKAQGQPIECGAVIWATGHSARDAWQVLSSHGVSLTPKPMSIGLRIEHPQSMVNEAQYGAFAGHPRLGAASYALTGKSRTTDRAVYSFCMCPGGQVVNASTEPGELCVNGMSRHARDGQNANAALVVPVYPADYLPFGSDPLAGVRFQRHYEAETYRLGGGGFVAPISTVGDFLDKNPSPKALGGIAPTYRPGVRPADLWQCLPQPVAQTLAEGIAEFGRKLKGFDRSDALLTGIEARTSAPVRVGRNSDYVAEGLFGLYPAGEGAGLAGGIISAAVDGLKAAQALMARYCC